MTDPRGVRRGAHRVGRRSLSDVAETAPGTDGASRGGSGSAVDGGAGSSAPWHAGPLARSILMSALAVVAVAAVIALVWVATEPGGPDKGTLAGGSGASTTPSVAPSSPAVTSAPAVTPSTPPAVAATAPSRARQSSSRPSRSPSRSSSRSVQPPVTAFHPAVVVLNNSRVQGLAAKAAADLRAGGWPIALVGNFTGRLVATTVYYDPGQESAANALAAQFPAIERVLPRFEGLPGHGLTLVVTRYYPH